MKQAIAPICGAVDSFENLAATAGCHLIVVLHPTPQEVAYLDSNIPFHPGIFVKMLSDSLLRRDVETIDLYPYFQELFSRDSVSKYAHPRDGHFNSRGYQTFAKAAFDIIENRKLME